MRWLLWAWLLLRRLLCRRVHRAGGGRRCRRSRGCRGRRRRRGAGGCRRDCRAGRWVITGAVVAVDQLDDAVDDESDQDRNKQGPADEHHGPAEPRGGLGVLVERVEKFGRLELLRSRSRKRRGRQYWRQRRVWDGRHSWRRRQLCTRWWGSAPAVVGVLGRLIVEVVRRSGCHRTDGTDAGWQLHPLRTC